MGFPDSRLQRNYVQLESAWGTIPNSTGTATLAGADAFLCMSLDMNGAQEENERPDKTGSLGEVIGTLGRKNASWSMKCSLAGSGAAGTVPDIDPFLVAAFGKAATLSAGVSATYDPEDASPSLAIWDFNALTTAAQRVLSGSIVQRVKISWGQNFGEIEFSGEGKHPLDTDEFSGADSIAKSGLTTFPSEPTAVVSGSSAPGYKGVITIDGVTYTTFRSGSIEMTIARVLPKDQWNSDYPSDPANGKRSVKVDLSMRDDDSTNFKALKNKAKAGTPVDMSFAVGNVAGNIWVPSLKNVILPKPAYNYSDTQRVVDFRGGSAKMSTNTSKDEIRLVAR